MPELPEVETIRRGLEKKLRGKTIQSVTVLEPRIVTGGASALQKKLLAQPITNISRHGKKLFIESPAATFSIHLRMTGQLIFVPRGTAPIKHTHIVIQFTDGSEDLHYADIRKFGRWKMEKPGDDGAPDAWLAPKADVLAALRRKRGMIKHALLNQNVVSGLGNIYVDESLYRAKIHPKKKIERLSTEKLANYYDGMRDILGKSIEIGGTSFRNYVDTGGKRGGFKEWLFVYGKQGHACGCGKIIKRIVVAGRGTHYCPGCQK